MPQLTRLTADCTIASGVIARPRRGFTLTELMIVVVVLGVLMGILSALFISQQRFYKDVGETAAVRRELRTGVGVLPLDIRGISGPGDDLDAYNSTTLEIKAPIGSAVICGIAADRKSFDIFPTNLSANTLSSFWTDPLPSDSIYIFDDSVSAGAEDDAWRRHSIGSIANSLGCPVLTTPYTSLAADAAALKPRRRITLGGGAELQANIIVGAVVRFTRAMEYSLFQPSAGSEWYIGLREYRNGAWGSKTPVSGPYRAPAGKGLEFTYYDTLGTQVTAGDSASRVSIARVDLALRAAGAEARSFGRSGAITDSLFLSIGIRNFR